MNAIDRGFGILDRLWMLDLERKGVTIGPGSVFSGRPIVSVEAGSSIVIGARFHAQSRASRQVMGIAHPAVLRTLRSAAELHIGDDCGMSGGSIVCATGIQIGDGCLLGADAAIIDTDFHPVDARDRRYAPLPPSRPDDTIRLGSNVFVGTRAVVMRGSRIGDNCVIGAGAVVRGTFPADVVIAGVPARVVRPLRLSDDPLGMPR